MTFQNCASNSHIFQFTKKSTRETYTRWVTRHHNTTSTLHRKPHSSSASICGVLPETCAASVLWNWTRRRNLIRRTCNLSQFLGPSRQYRRETSSSQCLRLSAAKQQRTLQIEPSISGRTQLIAGNLTRVGRSHRINSVPRCYRWNLFEIFVTGGARLLSSTYYGIKRLLLGERIVVIRICIRGSKIEM